MAKPYVHAESSARRYGGTAEAYLPVHQLMDSSKSAHPLNTHRAVFHSAFGVFVVEQVLGLTVTNSLGQPVAVRDLAEQHVLEDLGWIPTLSDYLRCMRLESWMLGPRGRRPPSVPDGTPATEQTPPPHPALAGLTEEAIAHLLVSRLTLTELRAAGSTMTPAEYDHHRDRVRAAIAGRGVPFPRLARPAADDPATRKD